MKILQIAKFFNPDTGGIETVTEQISNMLLPYGIVADVLCTEFDGPYETIKRPYAVYRCKAEFGVGNKQFSSQYARYVKALSPTYDCAIVHMPNPFAVMAMLAFWRKPIILLWHADTPQRWVRWLTGWADHKLITRASRVIGPTPIHLSESYHSNDLQSKGVVIPFPFDTERLPTPTKKSPLTQRVLSWARGRKLSISIGRLVPYKGFDVLIDSASYFDDDLAAVVVGGGALLDKYRTAISEKGVEDRVFFTGPVSDQELSDLLSVSSIACMPSISAAEMYGVAQVEAMSFGMPVVSTRLPRSGVSYVNRHNETGLIVEPNDAVGLADALNHLSRDKILYNNLSKGALKSYKNDHDIRPVGHKYADLIKSVVNSKN
jgi:glycosyltransferase involved in cell wall biosynthesis